MFAELLMRVLELQGKLPAEAQRVKAVGQKAVQDVMNETQTALTMLRGMHVELSTMRGQLERLVAEEKKAENGAKP